MSLPWVVPTSNLSGKDVTKLYLKQMIITFFSKFVFIKMLLILKKHLFSCFKTIYNF